MPDPEETERDALREVSWVMPNRPAAWWHLGKQAIEAILAAGFRCLSDSEIRREAGDFQEALKIISHIVSQANVNPVVDGEFISRYDMPVGSIHKAIPFLARHGIVVDTYGAVHILKEAEHG